MPISTESLKGLMPDIKPSLKLAPEPVLEDEMDYEDDTTTIEPTVPEQEDTRSVKIQRTVTQDVKKEAEVSEGDSDDDGDKPEAPIKQESSSEDDDNEDQGETGDDKREIKQAEDSTAVKVEPTEGQDEEMKEEPAVKQQTKTATHKVKKEKRDRNKEIKLIRRLDSGGSIMVKPDEPVRSTRSPSPARNPVSKIVHIRNLVRPFTANQLKELLRRTGTFSDETFWIDKIKSHCFAVYETEDEAVETRKALHNTKWPLSNPKTLIVDFGSEEQMDYYRGDEKPIPPPDKEEKLAAKEQKSKATTEKQKQLMEEREKEMERRRKEREKRMKEREDKEGGKTKFVREWDKDKKSREDWDRTLQKSRSRSPRERRSRGSRSPSKERRRNRSDDPSADRTDRREKKKAEKKEDEPPAKLLDDLFKKTKTTPCIYWLPLTEAQIAEKEKAGITRPALRQKQEGDRVSPMRDIPEGSGYAGGRNRSAGSPPRRRLSQEGDRNRGGRRPPPDYRRRPSSPEPRRRPSSPNPRNRDPPKRR